jgi:hypothetical protein
MQTHQFADHPTSQEFDFVELDHDAVAKTLFEISPDHLGEGNFPRVAVSRGSKPNEEPVGPAIDVHRPFWGQFEKHGAPPLHSGQSAELRNPYQ